MLRENWEPLNVVGFDFGRAATCDLEKFVGLEVLKDGISEKRNHIFQLVVLVLRLNPGLGAHFQLVNF